MPNSFARIFRTIRRSSVFAVLALVLALVAFPRAAAADVDKRVALVIGNGDYPNAALASPPNDVRALQAALRNRGFVVSVVENVDAKMLQAAVEQSANEEER